MAGLAGLLILGTSTGGVSAAPAVDLATVNVEKGPVGVGVTPDGERILVANSASGTVTAVNAATYQVEATIVVGGTPAYIAVSPVGKVAYVLDYDSALLHVIDTVSLQLVRSFSTPLTSDQTSDPTQAKALGISVNSTGTRVFVITTTGTCCNDRARLTAVDTSSDLATATVSLGGDFPWALAVNSQGSRVYVSVTRGVAQGRSGYVRVFDTGSLGPIAEVQVGMAPSALRLDAAGRALYVTDVTTDTVSAVDVASMKVTSTPRVGYVPSDVALSPDGAYLYVVNSLSACVTVLHVRGAPDGLVPIGECLKVGLAFQIPTEFQRVAQKVVVHPSRGTLFVTVTGNVKTGWRGTLQVVQPPTLSTVTFKPNGGSGRMANQNSVASTWLTKNSFVRTGYQFVGWNTHPKGKGTAYADRAVFPFSQDATLYAQWRRTGRFLTLAPEGAADGSHGVVSCARCPD